MCLPGLWNQSNASGGTVMAHTMHPALHPQAAESTPCLQDTIRLQGELLQRQHLRPTLPAGQPLVLHQLAAQKPVMDPESGRFKMGPHTLLTPQLPLSPVPGTSLTAAAYEHVQYCRREVRSAS